MKKIIVVFIVFLILFNLKYYQKSSIPIIDESIFSFNEPIDNVIGTIEFVRLKQKNEIKLGTEDYILNQNVVGMHELSVHLDKRPNNIVLAAHNKKSLFNAITKLRIGDIVNLDSIIHSYSYQVIKIKSYTKDYQMPFDSEKNQLILITCIAKNEKRLLVTLSEITTD